jgi:hypothetical protein
MFVMPDEARPRWRRRISWIRRPTRLGKPRSVPQTYRVQAVRRPSRARSEGERTDESGTPTTVADEEIVDAFLRHGDQFTKSLTLRLDQQLAAGERVGVTVRDVRPGGSVLLELVFTIETARNVLDVVGGFTAAVMLDVAGLLDATLGEPLAVSVAPAPTTATTDGAPTSRTGWDVISPVLAAIGTGIGVIGFVTFIGGVYVWARLNGNGFPAAPALSVIPKQDLLVIGASTLVPQLLVALLAVVVLSGMYLIARQLSKNIGEVEGLILAGETSVLGAIGMGIFVALALGATVIFSAGGLRGEDARLALVGVALGGSATPRSGLCTWRRRASF